MEEEGIMVEIHDTLENTLVGSVLGLCEEGLES